MTATAAHAGFCSKCYATVTTNAAGETTDTKGFATCTSTEGGTHTPMTSAPVVDSRYESAMTA